MAAVSAASFASMTSNRSNAPRIAVRLLLIRISVTIRTIVARIIMSSILLLLLFFFLCPCHIVIVEI
jgi:hypothetical protein